MTQLLPCTPTPSVPLNDDTLHVIQLEFQGSYMRTKVDGINFYPKGSKPNTCDEWRFFSPVPHLNSELEFIFFILYDKLLVI